MWILQDDTPEPPVYLLMQMTSGCVSTPDIQKAQRFPTLLSTYWSDGYLDEAFNFEPVEVAK